MNAVNLKIYHEIIDSVKLFNFIGKVIRVIGLTIEARGIYASVGELCFIEVEGETKKIPAEVVGFKEGSTLLMPLGDLRGISPGCRVFSSGKIHRITLGEELLGRVVGSLGQVLDGETPRLTGGSYPVNNDPPNPLLRKPITEKLTTGIKAIDAAVTCGVGQRLGIFSGSGVGKSTILGMIARNSSADINVIALIGERGREVREFIDRDLGKEGLARSVVVVSTSDQPSLLRVKGALVATTIAEFFRDQGKNVLLIMDSLTRIAMAQREIGLAIGEPPTTRGYTPSVFALLPKLLERAGNSDKGTITGLYAVLVEGDDMNEPISDAVRGILDGHVVLSRKLAAQNHYPAVDVLESISRLMPDITTKDHQKLASLLRDYLTIYYKNEDLINIGAYERGSSPQIDAAVDLFPKISEFLKQDVNESFDMEETLELLRSVFGMERDP